jgi:hypothetical protein
MKSVSYVHCYSACSCAERNWRTCCQVFKLHVASGWKPVSESLEFKYSYRDMLETEYGSKNRKPKGL